jgi:hypothetical protein
MIVIVCGKSDCFVLGHAVNVMLLPCPGQREALRIFAPGLLNYEAAS